MVMLGEVEDDSNVEAQVGTAADLVRGGVEDFGAERGELREATLEQPTEIPIVAVSLSRVHPQAPAAVAGPRAEALLQPERNEDVQVPGPQPAGRVASRQFEHREGTHHGPPLALVDEAELCTQLDVAHPIGSGTAAGTRVRKGHNHVKV